MPLVPPLKKRRETPWLMPLAIAAIVILVAIGFASLTIPNFVKARATSQTNADINKARQLDAEKNQFALANNNFSVAQPDANDYERVFVPSAHVLDGGSEMWVRKSDHTPAPPEVANTLNQEQTRLRLLASAQSENTPSAGFQQRLASLEARFQNGDPTANGGDAWKNQTTIVLPAGGTDDKELAAASPAASELPSMNFSFSGGKVIEQPSANSTRSLGFAAASGQAAAERSPCRRTARRHLLSIPMAVVKPLTLADRAAVGLVVERRV